MSAIPSVALTVTPDNANDLPYVSSLYVGVTGDLTVSFVNSPNTQVLFKAHPVGYLPGQVKRVYSTGTTATNIVALSA